MKNLMSTALATSMSLIVVGCANLPKVEDMQQLNSSEISKLLPGHTMTYQADWGRWAEYHKEDFTGVSKASGSWGKAEAISKYSIGANGEVCWRYEGEPDWAKPEFNYCAVFFTSEPGIFYSKVTENTRKPDRIGDIRKTELIAGDKYGLAGN